MRHDIVHLASDARTLGSGGVLRVLRAFGPQLTGSLHQRLDVTGAVADVHAHEAPEQEAHRKSGAPVDRRRPRQRPEQDGGARGHRRPTDDDSRRDPRGRGPRVHGDGVDGDGRRRRPHTRTG
ncbi:hypothetical protein GCM10023065_16720 [Microbacterium laevaniformans]|nr:hypothetical protein GCM10017578_01960 [Microbacterium laevaniformans]